MIGKAVMYKIALAVTVGLLGTVAGCMFGVTGSGRLETREFDYRDFTRVEAGSAFEVEITRADSYRVTITADDNVFGYLDIRKQGDTLHIGFRGIRGLVNTTQRAVITMPNLQGLNLSGASKGRVGGFSSANPLDLKLSGASSLDTDNLEAGDTRFDVSGAGRVSGNIRIANGKFDLSGASRVELTGSATDISIQASGASRLTLDDFTVRNASVNLSGASSATVNVSGQLDAKLSGASRLQYSGNPTLGTIDVSAGSELRRS